MALPRGVFHPKWTRHHSATVSSAGLARVQIHKIVSYGEWTPEEGMADDVIEVLYVGPARWQPSAAPTSRDFIEDQALFQKTLIQVGFNDNELEDSGGVLPDIPINSVVLCLENKADTQLVGTRVYVHGNATSSNPWDKALDCQENMKQG